MANIRYQKSELSNILVHIGYLVCQCVAEEPLDTNATKTQTNNINKETNKQANAKKCHKINATNSLGHVGRLVSVADEPLLAVRQPRDV